MNEEDTNKQSQEDSTRNETKEEFLIFDQIRDLLDKAQQMIYQAQAIVFEGKHKK